MASKTTRKTRDLGPSRRELVSMIAEETGYAKLHIDTVLASLEDIAVGTLSKGSPFSVPNIVRLRVGQKPARKEKNTVNPRTGEPMTIAAAPARKVIRARASKALRSQVLKG